MAEEEQYALMSYRHCEDRLSFKSDSKCGLLFYSEGFPQCQLQQLDYRAFIKIYGCLSLTGIHVMCGDQNAWDFPA